jgi:hypothetical protein
MSKNFYIILCFIILSCNQNSSQAEKDYIKNLEEKNRVLEKELQEIKNGKEPINTQKTTNKSDNSTKYFTIGSTEDEVIEVMGEPTTYMITAPEAKRFHYGTSTVYFYQGKVISYDNFEDNLKVRVKK